MTLSRLRRKHPRLIYQDFELQPEGKNLVISFNFLLEPDIRFRPEISIPLLPSLRAPRSGAWQSLIFHLGLVEAVSYWKAACPAELVVEAGYLNRDQIVWWKDLFIHGLGEFFYRNKIDFTQPDFLSIVNDSSPRAQSRGPASEASDINIAGARSLDFGPSGRAFARDDAGPIGDLILVGGGKDSIVTLETLKQIPGRKTALMLNPGPNSVAAARIAGYKNPLIVTRTISSRLLQLNKLGYLNGHTPFSAYLAFLGILVAYLHGYKNVISSNELGAGEASLIYKSMEINHQYSKSLGFEKLFREYCGRYLFSKQESPGVARRLLTDVNYFSFLRPLYELQIASTFSQLTKYDSAFTSCNVGRGKFWCGHCPKCAFSYLSLFPFMPANRLKNIFKSDLFENPQIQKHILDLVGLGQYKPFDCVGTKDESILAAALSIEKLRREGRQIPAFLLKAVRHSDPDLVGGRILTDLEKRIMENWSNHNFLPPEYSKILNRSLLTSSGDS